LLRIPEFYRCTIGSAAFGENIEYFQPDRIHPTERAQPLMLDAVWPSLSKLL
jgi:lysophospholipase L1-like esterase